MADNEKGKYVVLFTSGNFVFFKHKNDKGIYCPKSILNSTRTPLKDDIYDLVIEKATQQHHRQYPDMPEAAVLIATKAKFVKTPRVIQGTGTMKKVAGDGEYGFVEYMDGRTAITLFCTRITVKPQIEKGGMHKFFAVGCKVKFVAKEQPPSGMYNIEWRIITATDMRHDICPNNFEKVTPCAGAQPVATRPVAAAAAAAAPVAAARPAQQPAAATPAPPGLPAIPVSNGSANGGGGNVSASSSSSSVVNGVSFAARAASQLPERVADVVHRANAGPLGARTQLGDENLPMTAPHPAHFALSAREKEELRASGMVLQASENDPLQPVHEVWRHYRREAEGHLEPFESQLSEIRHVANCLYGGDSHVCPVAFKPRFPL